MNLTEQQYIILFSLIKFYVRQQEDILKSHFGTELYDETYKYFKLKIEFFVNQKIALDRIYTSLSNASQTYALFRQFKSNGMISEMPSEDTHKMFMSFNESFISALIINFSKLNEVLTFKKTIIVKDDSLCNDFSYLDDLNTKIKNAKLTELRNGWFAHAFEKPRNGIVWRDKDISENIFSILRQLCLEKDLDDYNKSADRLYFFCERYLFEGYTTTELKPSIYAVLHKNNSSKYKIVTKPKDILFRLSLFSKKIKDIKLFGIENFFTIEDDELKKWSENPSEYFKNELDNLTKSQK